MNMTFLYRIGTACTLALMTLSPGVTIAFGKDPKLDPVKLEKLIGVKGKLDEKEGGFKVSVPRTDLQISVTGIRMTPPLGLTSWAAFTTAGAHILVMGDMVLLEEQVNPVMSVALDNGLEVTALHNHFLWDSPKVMFMHIGGGGDGATLSRAAGQGFSKI